MLERYYYDLLAWWQVQKQRALEGQSLAEYGLILALIALVAIAALTALGGGISGILEQIAGQLSGGG